MAARPNNSLTYYPYTVGALYFIFAPDCPIDRTTIFVNPTSEGKIVRGNIFPTILLEISDRAV